MERIEKFLHSYEARNVLDVATGQGNFIPFILKCKSYDKIIAIDSVPGYGKILETQFADKKVKFQVADAYKLPFNDNCFDTVTFSNSIHHFENPELVLAEMKRVLKPTGKIIIHEMYSDHLSPAQESHKIIHHISAKRDMILGNFHADTYSKQELSRFINSHLKKEILFDYSYPAGDVMELGRIENILNICDTMIAQAEKSKKLHLLISEFARAKAYIQEHGYASASSLFFVGRK